MSESPIIKQSIHPTAKKYPFIAVWSFAFLYSFYNAYFLEFASSPISLVTQNAGIGQTITDICLFAAVPGVALCFSSAWMRLLSGRGFKISLHACAFAAPMLLPLSRNLLLACALLSLGMFCGGAMIGRALYTSIFATIDFHPTHVVAMIYLVFQTYIHAFAILPVLHTLPFYYIAGAPTLLAGLIISYLYDGDNMERRRVLPENTLRLADVWAPLAVITLALAWLAIYGTVLLPQLPAQPLDPVFQIIPNAVTLLAFFLFGRRLSLRSALSTLSILLACTVMAFVMDDSVNRALIQMFTEPAFLFYDLFLFWLLQSAFFAYGRRLARLKLFIVIDVSFIVCVTILTQLAVSHVPLEPKYALLLLPPGLALALLIPQTERALKIMDARRLYAEGWAEQQVPLPDEREYVLAVREILLQTLPPVTLLTDEEQTALCYLIDGQDTDITAHFMGIPVAKALALTAAILHRFNCGSKTELIARMGVAQAEASRRNRLPAMFEKYGLTKREQEICRLLLGNLAQKQIADKLGLGNETVKSYIKNLYRKLNIQSRPALVALFTEAEELPGMEEKG